jgi:hypothetical protein
MKEGRVLGPFIDDYRAGGVRITSVTFEFIKDLQVSQRPWSAIFTDFENPVMHE